MARANTWLGKSLLVCGSILLVLFVAELSLDLAGGLYADYRLYGDTAPSVSRAERRILCIGDSFTFGIGANKGFSYPEQLSALLNEQDPDGRWGVVNRGVPGTNSSQALKELPALLEQTRPAVVVVMTGGRNNRAQMADSNYFLFAHDYSWQVHLDSILSRSRLYKLAKAATRAHAETPRSAPQPAQAKPTSIDAVLARADVLIVQRDYDGARRLLDQLRRSNPSSARVYLMLGTLENETLRPAQARTFLERSVALDPGSAEAHFELAKPYMRLKDYGRAIEQLRRAIAIADSDMGEDNVTLAYLSLVGIFEGLKDEDSALRTLEEGARARPWNTAIINALKAHQVRRHIPSLEDRIFYNLLRSDLTEIVTLAQRHGAKAILLGYPAPMTPELALLPSLARQYGALFVDNQRVFDSLRAAGVDDLFVSDGHCNDKGYKVVADNVYRAMKEAGLLSIRKAP